MDFRGNADRLGIADLATHREYVQQCKKLECVQTSIFLNPVTTVSDTSQFLLQVQKLDLGFKESVSDLPMLPLRSH